MITDAALISTILKLIIVFIVSGIFRWLLDYVKIGEQFTRIGKRVVAVFAVFMVVHFLLGLVGLQIIK